MSMTFRNAGKMVSAFAERKPALSPSERRLCAEIVFPAILRNYACVRIVAATALVIAVTIACPGHLAPLLPAQNTPAANEPPAADTSNDAGDQMEEDQ
jgi:hypothetical protein